MECKCGIHFFWRAFSIFGRRKLFFCTKRLGKNICKLASSQLCRNFKRARRETTHDSLDTPRGGIASVPLCIGILKNTALKSAFCLAASYVARSDKIRYPIGCFFFFRFVIIFIAVFFITNKHYGLISENPTPGKVKFTRSMIYSRVEMDTVIIRLLKNRWKGRKAFHTSGIISVLSVEI